METIREKEIIMRLRYNDSITNREAVSWSMPQLAYNQRSHGSSSFSKVWWYKSQGGRRVLASAACVGMVVVVMVETTHKNIGDREIVPWCLVPPSAFADDTLALPVPDRMEKFERQVRKTTLNFS